MLGLPPCPFPGFPGQRRHWCGPQGMVQDLKHLEKQSGLVKPRCQRTNGYRDKPALRLRESAAMYRMMLLSATYRADQENLKTPSGGKKRATAKREEYTTPFNCCFCCTDRTDRQTDTWISDLHGSHFRFFKRNLSHPQV